MFSLRISHCVWWSLKKLFFFTRWGWSSEIFHTCLTLWVNAWEQSSCSRCGVLESWALWTTLLGVQLGAKFIIDVYMRTPLRRSSVWLRWGTLPKASQATQVVCVWHQTQVKQIHILACFPGVFYTVFFSGFYVGGRPPSIPLRDSAPKAWLI